MPVIIEGNMKLKVFTNGKIEQGFVLINKYGAIRFKKELATELKFVRDERWLIGTDENEKGQPKFLYILRPDKEHEGTGFKIQHQNKSWFITCRTLLNEIKLDYPVKLRLELYKDDQYNGFRIILPTP